MHQNFDHIFKKNSGRQSKAGKPFASLNEKTLLSLVTREKRKRKSSQQNKHARIVVQFDTTEFPRTFHFLFQCSHSFLQLLALLG